MGSVITMLSLGEIVCLFSYKKVVESFVKLEILKFTHAEQGDQEYVGSRFKAGGGS
jgi:hypothetical protein